MTAPTPVVTPQPIFNQDFALSRALQLDGFDGEWST
jgi:hypothetical protein